MPVDLNPQYIVDKQKNPKGVLLSMEEWEQVVEELEELDDIRAYDAAKAGRQDTMPFEEAVKEIREKDTE